MRIGIIDYHGDLSAMLAALVPPHHEVVMLPAGATAAEVRAARLHLLFNHYADGINSRYTVPFIAVPYGSVSQRHIDGMQRNPLCRGVADQSGGDLARRFPSLRLPTFAYAPFYAALPTYEVAGDRVICLVMRYQERFPRDYAFARSVTPHVYGDGDTVTDDVAALRHAAWLLHVKGGGFVCNAVGKALACGVPVIMDEATWRVGHYSQLVRHERGHRVAAGATPFWAPFVVPLQQAQGGV
jgi:hypothetical protein